MDFYHVARESININPIELRPISYFLNPENTYLEEKDIDELKKYHLDGLSSFGERHIFPDNNSLKGKKHLNQLDAENFYEEIRRKYYPNKPSRYSSFFACKTLSDANYLINNTFKCLESIPPCKIYHIECQNYFIFDMNLLWTDFSKGKGEIKDMALRYWSQEKSNNPFWEVLCQPPIKIINL